MIPEEPEYPDLQLQSNYDLEIDLSKIKNSGQQLIFYGVQANPPFLTRDGFSLVYFKKGQTAIKTLNKMGVLGGKAFKEDFIENFNVYNNYNWGAYADRNNYTNIDLVCVEDGYLFGCCEYGFVNQCTHVKYLLNGNKVQNGVYICTDEDVYLTKLAGKLFETPTHKEGKKAYTHTTVNEDGTTTEDTIELIYIGKLGKFEIRCE